MEQSILTSTKKILGIGPDDNSFDHDVITHINAAFSTLQQLGVGPVNGFAIEDETIVWNDFLDVSSEKVKLGYVKTYVYLSVRLFFDPPTTSFLLAAQEKQKEELEWRLNVNREETDWVDPDPDPPVVEEESDILDGGVEV